MIPQIIFLCLVMLGLGLIFAKHGEPRTDKYNVVVTLISDGIVIGLLYWGGFFDCFYK